MLDCKIFEPQDLTVLYIFCGNERNAQHLLNRDIFLAGLIALFMHMFMH